MKIHIVAIMLTYAVGLFGQTEITRVDQSEKSPPPLKVYSTFLESKNLLGQEEKTWRQVNDHLKKYDAGAAWNWERAQSNRTNSAIWSGITVLSGVISFLAEEPSIVIATAGVAVVSCGLSIGYSISANNKTKKAVYLYNTKYGY